MALTLFRVIFAKFGPSINGRTFSFGMYDPCVKTLIFSMYHVATLTLTHDILHDLNLLPGRGPSIF